tara:strand:- start:4544 stop:5035 length:492 start_codon:yes stop_codon:yes gene_type:complete
MNEELIKNWNALIGDDDEVYHLGDVSLTNSSKTEEILYRLNGKIYLINGNHEKSVDKSKRCRDRFEWIKDYYELKIDNNGEKSMMVMCHYAMRVWNKSHHNSIHLYGHSHDSLEYQAWGKSMDVGVDSAARILGEYRPFRFSEIKNILDKREKMVVDHHTGRT